MAKSAPSQKLTATEIGAVVARLSGILPGREAHAPLLLGAWAEHYRPIHEPTSKVKLRTVNKHLKRLSAAARTLDSALASAPPIDPETGGYPWDGADWHLATALSSDTLITLQPDEQDDGRARGFGPNEGLRKLKVIRGAIEALSAASEKALAATKSDRGPSPRPDRVHRIEGLAEIYHYLTGKKPARANHRIENLEYGPFFEFASTAWVSLFGTAEGFGSATKDWAKQYAGVSRPARWGLIHVVARQNPAWRLFVVEKDN